MKISATTLLVFISMLSFGQSTPKDKQKLMCYRPNGLKTEETTTSDTAKKSVSQPITEPAKKTKKTTTSATSKH